MTLVAAKPSAARYAQLLERTAFDLKLTHDSALAANVPFARLQRINRARREIEDERRTLTEMRSDRRRIHLEGTN
jgi:hypothetical protein